MFLALRALWPGSRARAMGSAREDGAGRTEQGLSPTDSVRVCTRLRAVRVQGERKLGTWCSRAPQDKAHSPVFIEALRLLLLFNTMPVSHLPPRLVSTAGVQVDG